MKLVCIHGRGQGKFPAEELRMKWRDSWLAGLRKSGIEQLPEVEFVFPYYGDILDELTRQLKASAKRKGDLGHTDEEYVPELMWELAMNGGISEKEIDATEEIKKAFQNQQWVIDLARKIDEKYGAGFCLSLALPDAYTYLTESIIQEQIDELVKLEIGTKPCVVVGHSLGSAVGFNIINQDASLNVQTFVTLGSPLGMKTFHHYLPFCPRYPLGLKGDWYNAFDKRDIVALRSLDQEYFKVEGTIENYEEVDNFTKNRHSIEGYLSDKQVALKIYDALLNCKR